MRFHYIIYHNKMNLIQKAWLVVLRPLTGFVNEKLAKKSGLFGRIGRFYAFGPREFGYHPTNKLLAYVNQNVVANMGLLFHKYSFVKSLTMNGHTFMRNYRVLMLLGMVSFIGSVFIYTVPDDYKTEEATTLTYLKDRLNATPINALQNRASAHFTEINSYYMHEMAKKFIEKQAEVISKRNACSDQVKKTKYARPGYTYVAAHSNYSSSAQE